MPVMALFTKFWKHKSYIVITEINHGILGSHIVLAGYENEMLKLHFPINPSHMGRHPSIV